MPGPPTGRVPTLNRGCNCDSLYQNHQNLFDFVVRFAEGLHCVIVLLVFILIGWAAAATCSVLVCRVAARGDGGRRRDREDDEPSVGAALSRGTHGS
jgi:hypothetical protein